MNTLILRAQNGYNDGVTVERLIMIAISFFLGKQHHSCIPSSVHQSTTHWRSPERIPKTFSLAPLLGSVLQLGDEEESFAAVGSLSLVKNPLVGGKTFGETASHRTVNTARGCVQLFLG